MGVICFDRRCRGLGSSGLIMAGLPVEVDEDGDGIMVDVSVFAM